MRYVVALVLFLSQTGFAMPTLSQQGCALVADAAIVARSLAVSGIDEAKAADIMKAIYDEALHPYLSEISDAAYAAGEVRPAKQFAQELLATCFNNAGDLKAFLGVRL